MGTRSQLVSALVAATLSLSAAGRASADVCTPSAAVHRKIVLDFYNMALVRRQPRAGFERYASASFVEHKPEVRGGAREDVIKHLEGLIASVPEPRWEILRTVAENDFVFLHARFTPAPGAPSFAVADLFRLADCRIVEHWDVVAGPPSRQVNPNPRF